MERQLDPIHSEARRKSIELIREHIARAVLGAARQLDPTEEHEPENNNGQNQ